MKKLKNKKNNLKIISFLVWSCILFSFVFFKIFYNLSFLDIAKNIFNILVNSFWGPFIFILIYALRPVVFFPATLLTALSGVLFGFWYGFFYVIVGENISANFAYFLGRYFGSEILDKKKEENNFLKKWKEKIAKNSFEAVLIMRFIYLPFDLTNYGCGILKVKWNQYFLATFLGIIPGVLTFVSLGASFENIQNFNLEDVSVNTNNLILSIFIFVSSLLLASYIRKKKKIN